jgi:hypothetical protein
MSKFTLYLLALLVLLSMPLAKINSQEQKQEKKPPVTLDMDDVASSRNNGRASTVRKGATNQFEFRSTNGDFIGQDKMKLYKADEGWFKVTAEYQAKTRDVKTVRIEFAELHNSTFRMTFSIPKHNYGFVPGAYKQAFRYIGDPNEENPAMDVSFDGRGCARLVGEFAVYEAEFDTSGSQPKVISFAASFSQQCSGKGMLEGSVYFNAVPTDAIEKKK